MLGPGSNTTDTTWRGPCPNGNLHTYTLTIYALRTATFSGGNSNTTIRTALENMSNADVLARARVNGMSNARQQ